MCQIADKKTGIELGPPCVNFINILQAAFAPIFFCQKKKSKPNCNQREAAQSTFVQKNVLKWLMKLTPVISTYCIFLLFKVILIWEKIEPTYI